VHGTRGVGHGDVVGRLHRGPNDVLDRLHAWMRGGEPGRGVDVVDAMFETTGAVVMGRRTFDLGDKENGWVADPPFKVPMFVPAHDVPDRVVKDAAPTLTFVTDGIDGAVEKARAAAGDRNVVVSGASTGQQCLGAGHLDELRFIPCPCSLATASGCSSPASSRSS
jgi:dihydrofolate reductase